MSQSKTTTDHKTIRAWAEARQGTPVTVRGTGDKDEPGVLRIDFPGYSGGDRFEEISWEEWFEKFDANELAFLYQEQTSGGEESRFFKLVRRSEGADDADDKPKEKARGKDNKR